jgi:phenylpropionate dioxygenase-like ring-hydroxylating dioxygenase large terminal subunit
VPSFDNREEELLTRVGPGTPSGEVFRRYWIPVEVSANLVAGRIGEAYNSAKNPLRLRVLGEDLVLYRDSSGQPGLLAEHCSHRGTSLVYGRVEGDAIRCIYHGWAYDRDGHCVDTPCEPPDSNLKRTIRHPAYPCVEVGGLIFAYMGPPDRQPLFPKYEVLFRTDGVRVTGNGGYIQNCNVFQAQHDNSSDPWHREILHQWFKGVPPQPGMHHAGDDRPATPVRFEATPWGTRNVILMDGKRPGEWHYKETHIVFPGARHNIEQGFSMKWATPIDDAHTRWFQVDFLQYDDNGNAPAAAVLIATSERPNQGRANLPEGWQEQVGYWWNFGHPWRQGVLWEDDVAIGSQGGPERHFLPNWENWHLGTSDRGLLVTRELWREQVRRVQAGLDPIGVVRDPEQDGIIDIPAAELYGDWESAHALFSMTIEERQAFNQREPQAKRPNAHVAVAASGGGGDRTNGHGAPSHATASQK